MGVAEDPFMLFNLGELVPLHTNLEDLVIPFTHDEVDQIIRALPSDKALGPHGFNGCFLKIAGL